ncbi:MAG: hypothetical protein KAT70_01520 [Thermoplasmata archaeon]|nr:hypothetical protein [Thermoplasmata archaeon]
MGLCPANSRMGGHYTSNTSYLSSSFADGTYKGVAVTTDLAFIGSLEGEMAEACSVLFFLDAGEHKDTALGDAFRRICIESGYDSQRVLSEPVWGQGSFCGSIGLRADLAQGRMEMGWQERRWEDMPPFFGDNDMLAVETMEGQRLVGYMKRRDILCAPICAGAIEKGLKNGDEQVVEPYNELTVVANASLEGAIRLLDRLKQ